MVHKRLKPWLSLLLACTMVMSGIVPYFGANGSFGVQQGSAQATPTASTSTPTLNIGDYIQFGKYNNAPILWRVVHNDPTTGDPILLSDRILTLKPFDAANGSNGSVHTDTNRQTYGSNYYKHSNIRQWLNSSSLNSGSDLIDWIQNDPVSTHNSYKTEKGFLATGNFTATERSLIKPLTHKVVLASADQSLKDGGTQGHTYDATSIANSVQNYDTTAFYQNMTDSVLIPSLKQLKEWVVDNSETLGTSYSVSKPTPEAVTQSTYQNFWLDSTKPFDYWTTTPNAATSYSVRAITSSGNFANNFSNSGIIGIRPALQLNKTAAIFKSGAGSSASPYQLDFKDAAPTDIALSKTSFYEDIAPGTKIAVISSSGDPLLGDTATYSLVSGQGDADNGLFTISGTDLVLGASSIDASVKNSASIRIRVTDSNNNSYEEAVVITINPVTRYLKAGNATRLFDVAGTAIDPGLTITTTNPGITPTTSVSGATVLIGTNFESGKDTLSYTGTLPSGVTATAFNTATGLLRFNGSTTPANWQALLRTVRFTSTSSSNKPREIYFTLGTALPLKQANGTIHYYEYVGTSASWSSAKTAAEARKAAGVVDGYLATPNTKAEFDFMALQFAGNTGWLGGSDEVSAVNSAFGLNTTTGFASQSAVEGKFHWVTGPADERAMFSQGNSPNAVVVSGQYAKWRSGEPNNYNGAEHHVEFTDSGLNDNGGSSSKTYFTEYYDSADSISAVVTVNDGAPTDITPSSSTFSDAVNVGGKVATLSASDPLPNDTFTYQLVSGSGDTDNGKFQVDGTTLRLKQAVNSGTQSSFSIRVRVTDSGNLSFEKALTLTAVATTKYINASKGWTTATEASSAIDLFLVVNSNQSPWNDFSSITGATVMIADNFESGKDSLSYTDVLPAGVTVSSFNATTGVLRFNGSNSPQGWQGILRRVKYNTTSTTTTPRTIYFTIGQAVPFQTKSGVLNYYEQVPTSTSWTSAKTAAEARKTAGVLNGHLATVNEAAENEFLRVQFNKSGWLGGTDDFSIINTATGKNTTTGFANQTAAEGKYHWIGGAENGTLFSTGNSPNAVSATGQYSNWKSGEPNNTGSVEHHAEFTTTGWNDLQNTNNREYFVEYNGSAATLSTSVLVYLNTAPTNIALSSNTVLENAASGTTVGSLTGTDPNALDSLSFSLVSGIGGLDNLRFTLDGTTLKTTAPLDYEAKSIYSIRVRATDSGGLTFDKILTINAVDVNDAPSGLYLSGTSELKVGDYVQFGKYNHAPILWRIINKETTGNLILFADRILTLKQFDAAGYYHCSGGFCNTDNDQNRAIYGSNYYPDSNIRQWLNSSSSNSGADVIDWIQNDPIANSTYSYYGHNPYHTEKGFLANGNFTAEERALIKPYTHKVIVGPEDAAKADGGSTTHVYNNSLLTAIQNYDTTAYYKNVTDQVFLLSVKQLKEWVADRSWSHYARPTPEAVEQSTYKNTTGLTPLMNYPYYLTGSAAAFSSASYLSDNASLVRSVSGNGIYNNVASDGTTGIRPALQLNMAAANFSIGAGTSDNPYMLSSFTVEENQPLGTIIGTFSRADDDLGDTATYTMVSGEGDADNGSFSINGSSLKLNTELDYETKSSYSIRVRVTDGSGATYEKTFAISVSNVKEAPSDIRLSTSAIAENSASGSTVGTLSATGVDTGDTATYTLVSGTGSTDNASFSIDGTALKTKESFDFETKSGYSIRVRVTIGGGLFYEKSLTISVTDDSNEVNYTVTFDSNGGSAIANKTLSNGQKVSQPVNPTKWKNTFVAWYSNQALTTLYDFNTPVTSDLTLYAKWVINNTDGHGFSGWLMNPQAINDTPAIDGFGQFPTGTNTTSWMFNSGVYDGTNIWLTPANAGRLVKVNPVTGAMTGFTNWPSGFNKGNSAFQSAAFDGQNLWLVPYSANQLVKFDRASETMTAYTGWPSGFVKGLNAFYGAAFDGTSLWMIPHNADRLIRVNPATGAMTGYNSWPTGFIKGTSAFAGGVYDGTYLWMIPFNADRLIRVNPATGEMTGYNSWPSGYTKGGAAFHGGVFDGTHLWLIPHNADRLIRVNPATGEMTGFNQWPAGFMKGTGAFSGGAFDGKAIWMTPARADRIIKFDIGTSQMTGYNSWPSGFVRKDPAFAGGVYDGKNVWLVPDNVNQLLRVSSGVPVTFEVNGGSSVAPKNAAIGGKLIAPPAPTKSGFVFGGWYTDHALTVAYDFDTAVQQSFTLYAKWDLGPYPVTFNSNSGSRVVSQTVAYNGTVTQPANPTRAGYLFAGWYTDAAWTTAYDFAAPVTDTLILYAKWNMIILNNNKLRFGDGLTAPALDSKGNLYLPAFNSASGTNTPNWSKLVFSPSPVQNHIIGGGDGINEWWNTKSNATFSDYIPDSLEVDVSGYTSTSATSGYGTVAVSFDAIVNNQVLGIQHTYHLGQNDSFIRIKTRATNKGTAPIANLRFIPQFADDFLINSDVTLKTRGVFANGQFLKSVQKSDRTNAIKVSANQHSILMYTTSPNATSVIGSGIGYPRVSNTDPALSDIEKLSDGSYGLYVRLKDLAQNESDEFTWYYGASADAQFAQTMESILQDAGIFSVTFDSNGGTAVSAQNVLSGAKVRLPQEPVKAGYSFLGWYTDAGLTTNYDFDSVMNSNLQLYAKWQIDARFVKNNGEPDLVVSMNGTDPVSEPATPTRVGYTFGGWYADANVTVPYDFNTPVTSSTFIYAKWTLNGLLKQDGLGYSGLAVNPQSITNPVVKTYNQWPTGVDKSQSVFVSTVDDGTNIWFIPSRTTDSLIKLNKASGQMTPYTNWQGSSNNQSYTISSSIYDGTHIWLIPQFNDAVIKFDPLTETATRYQDWPVGFTGTQSNSSNAFRGAIFDSRYLWLIPADANQVVRVDSVTGSMKGYSNWPSGFTKGALAFAGGVYDGTNIWLVPYKADRLIRFNTLNGEMTGYNSWPAGLVRGTNAFVGGTFDGQAVWLAPYDANQVVRVNVLTGQMTGYNSWPIGFAKGTAAFAGATYDGNRVWLTPHGANRLISIDVNNGQMASHDHWPAGFTIPSSAFYGAVYDGTSIWIAPYNSGSVLRITSGLSVGFESNGGTTLTSQAVVLGDAATRPADPSKEGVEFLGWYSDAALSMAYDFSAPVTADITLYAKWSSSLTMSLSANSLAENSASGTTVGTLSASGGAEPVTFTLVSGTGDTDNDSFAIDGTNLNVADDVDFETKPSYSIRVQVTDANGQTHVEVFTITVTNVNEAASDMSLSASSITENSGAGATVGALSADDPDAGDSLSFSLVAGSGDTDNAAFTISGNNLIANNNLNYETNSSYSVRVQVTDSTLVYEKTFTIIVSNVNEPVTALNLSETEIDEGSAIGSDVGMLSAVDEDMTDNYTYTLVSGAGDSDNAAFTISGNTLKTAVELDYAVKSQYSIRVRVTDDGGNTYERVVIIIVNDLNDAPYQLALNPNYFYDTVVASDEVSTLQVSDPDTGDTFSFDLVSGNGDTDNAMFTISGNKLVTATTFVNGTYTIRVRVTDSAANTFEQVLAVTVHPFNHPPSNILPDSMSVTENVAIGTVVDTLLAVDSNVSDTFIFELVSGDGSTDNALFTIDGDRLKTNALINFEQKGQYSIRVRVTDSQPNTYEKIILISVDDVNEAPSAISLSADELAENVAIDTIVGSLAATDSDYDDSQVFDLVSGAGDTDNDLFAVENGNLVLKTALNFESKASLSVRVRVTDEGGMTFETTLTITVTNMNEAPSGLSLDETSLDENLAVGTSVGVLSSNDPDIADNLTYSLVSGTGSADNARFTIDGATLKTVAAFNYEAKSGFSIRVRVTDAAGLAYETVFTITVTDVNDNPSEIAISNASLAENNAVDAVIGTLSGTDDDAGDTLTFSLVSGEGGTDNASFTISGTSLLAAKRFSYENKASYSIRLRVTDGNGGSYEHVLTIVVTDLDEAPTNLTLSNTGISENAAVGSLVGLLNVADEDNGESFTFTFVGGTGDMNNDLFLISGNQLRTLSSFNYEAKSNYTVRVRVTDSSGLTYETALTVQVLNVNEVPTGMDMNVSTIEENLETDSLVGTFSATDEDIAETLSFTLVSGAGDTDNDAFTIVGNELRINAIANYEQKSSYSIRVRVIDLAGDSYEQTWTITVRDVNEGPSDISLSNASIDENSAVDSVVGTFSAVDEDLGDTATYSLVSGDGDDDNSSFVIDGLTLKAAAGFDFESQSSYTIRVKVTDGSLSYEEAFTITVNDVNEAPTEIDLTGTTVDENSATGTVVGTLSGDDRDSGDTLTFTLVSGDGANDNDSFSIDGTTLKTAVNTFDYEADGSYSIRLQVSDGTLTYEKVFTVTVNDVNETMTDLTLSNTSVDEESGTGATVGSLGSNDPDAGSTLTFTLVNGTGDTDNASFTIDGTTVKTAVDFDYETGANSYSVRVQVSDGTFTYAEVFTITVNDTVENTAPTDIDLSATTIDENSGADAVVGTLSGTDAEPGDTLTFTLVSGAGDIDNTSFTIDGTLLKAVGDFDYETDAISYSIRVQVSDGSLTYEESFMINVNDVNEGPTEIELSATSIDENAGADVVIGTLSGDDPDSGHTLAFSLVSGTGDMDNAGFSIDGSTLKAVGSFDYESSSGLSIRVQVTDGELTYEEIFAISVNDLNDAPTDISLSSASIDENSGADAIVGTLSGDDADAGSTLTFILVSGTGDTDNSSFTIDGTTLKAVSDLDYETDAISYSIRVQVTDGSLTYDESFTISVNDVNEAPTDIELSSASIDENSGADAVVGTLSGDDPDAGTTLTFSLVSGEGDTDNASFAIDGITLKVVSSLDYETASSYSIRVQVSDGSLKYEETFAILVNNLNDAPTDIGLSSTSIDEDAGANATVGTLSGTDADAGDTLTFSLVSGTGDIDNANFTIDGTTLKAVSSFDYETASSYSIRIEVSDGSLSYQEAFTITVNNANEAPTDINLSATSIDENGGANASVGTLSGTDADVGDTLTFTLVSGTGDTDNASFTISGTSLQATNNLDFETKSSYSIRVQVSDGSLSYQEAFTITVKNVNESPTDISLSVTSINENAGANATVGMLSGTDVDGGDTLTFTLVSGAGDTDNASFNINGTTLRATNSLDFETQSSYSIRIQVSDGSLSYQAAFTITVNNVNEAPTDISLSATSINENAGANATVGTLTAGDPDGGQTLVYTLVTGTGSTDNGSFIINGSSLIARNSLNFEAKSSYTIRIQVSDGSLSYQAAFTITVNDVNEAPTNVNLSNNRINENAGANATVGTLSGTDADAGSTFTFALVTGTGSTDNASFNISGTTLRATNSLDFETKSSYSIRVRVTDNGGLTFERVFAITVNDLDDTAPTVPTNVALSTLSATSATVTWNASADSVGVTGYEVYLNGILVGTVTGRTYTFSGLSANTTYLVTIRALDAAGNKSAPSTTLTFTTVFGEEPTAPTNLTLQSATSNNIRLSWTASVDNKQVRGYEIYLNGILVDDQKNTDVNIKIPRNMKGLGTYTVTVVAYDRDGNRSLASSPLVVTIAP